MEIVFDNMGIATVLTSANEMIANSATTEASGADETAVAGDVSTDMATGETETNMGDVIDEAATDTTSTDETATDSAVTDEVVTDTGMEEEVPADAAIVDEAAGGDIVLDDPYVDPGYNGETGEGMYADTDASAVKDPLLSNWFFVIGISAAVFAVSVVLGVLLARRKIKKGIELYED